MSREDALLERALAGLEAAPRDRHSPWRWLQLATTGPDGTPEVRTLVLRGFDRATLAATFHADRRSPKIGAISGQPAVALLAWASGEQLQIRAGGTASVHAGDATAQAAWEALSPGARATYALVAVPGAAVTAAQADARLADADAFAQFAVIRVAIARLDLLELGPDGAQFRVCAEGGGAARRVGP